MQVAEPLAANHHLRDLQRDRRLAERAATIEAKPEAELMCRMYPMPDSVRKWKAMSDFIAAEPQTENLAMPD